MVERGGFRPRPGEEKYDAGSQQGGNAPGGEASQFIRNLIEQKGLQGGDPYDPFYLMEEMTRYEGGTYSEGIANTARKANIPIELSQTIHNVWIAYGLAVYQDPRLEGWMRDNIQCRVDGDILLRQIENDYRRDPESITLNDQERDILVKIAGRAGVHIDPKKKEYFYSEIPRLPNSDYDEWRDSLSEQGGNIVDGTER